MTDKPDITFLIDGRTVARDEIVPYEMQRLRVAAERLGVELPEGIDEARRAVLARKLELGHEGVEALCASDIRKAAVMVRSMRALSFGASKPCQMEVFARGITGSAFVAWFEEVSARNDEAAMLAAHPEHYLITNSPNGLQHVIETNGGSPFTAEFTIDFSDKTDARARALPDYPWRIAGRGVNEKGKRIGGALHQFQDTPDGLHGVLSIDFPARTPTSIISGHKKHLAVEFSNWIEAAAASL